MEIFTMTLEDLEQMKNTLYSDFDNFWSYNVLKQELENKLFQNRYHKKDQEKNQRSVTFQWNFRKI